ncbi:MAG TPA: peptide chain release factor 1 [Candidatus Dormibacteraeota bacterium]|nr:peptide chain release factor 1 [Candidatus Dormibacteraeota bacterium]
MPAVDDLDARVRALEERYTDLERELSAPDAFSDLARLQKLSREQARMREVVETGRAWRAARVAAVEAEEMARGEVEPGMRELAEEEARAQRQREVVANDRLHVLLLPRDPDDDRDVIVEVRAGTGGEEAALFAADLVRMYSRYAERRHWGVELLDTSESGTRGLQKAIFAVHGDGAYSRLKFESGVHRVQRVPETEAQGRVHTSAASVVVLPEPDEVEVNVDENDLKVDVYRSTGPGGQSVNTTDSAVRITHLPTGLVVTCQDEKSQHKNKAKALRELRARLYDLAAREQQDELTATRRSAVGTGDRSEKVRTYNFPQSRVTDHRIGLTTHQLDKVLDGDLEILVEPLLQEDQTRRLMATDAV